MPSWRFASLLCSVIVSALLAVDLVVGSRSPLSPPPAARGRGSPRRPAPRRRRPAALGPSTGRFASRRAPRWSSRHRSPGPRRPHAGSWCGSTNRSVSGAKSCSSGPGMVTDQARGERIGGRRLRLADGNARAWADASLSPTAFTARTRNTQAEPWGRSFRRPVTVLRRRGAPGRYPGVALAVLRYPAAVVVDRALRLILVMRDPPAAVAQRRVPDQGGLAVARDRLEALRHVRDADLAGVVVPHAHRRFPAHNASKPFGEKRPEPFSRSCVGQTGHRG